MKTAADKIRALLAECSEDDLKSIRASISNRLIGNRSGGRNGGRPALPRCYVCERIISGRHWSTTDDNGRRRHTICDPVTSV